MKYLAQVFLCCFLFSSPLLAQLEGIKYDNEVYLDYIKTVNFSHQGLSTSLPIIDLNSSGVLALSFDDLEGGDKTYRYQIIHCDRNWVPTDMDDLNYVEGFQDEDIQETYYSSGTVIDYTHYKLTLPNEDIKWTISGNFILAIYEDEYEPTLAITRRFLVAEKNVIP